MGALRPHSARRPRGRFLYVVIAGSRGAGLSRGTSGTETDRADFIRGLRSLECVPTAQQPASSLRSRPGPPSGPESSMVAPLTFFSTPTQCRAHSGRRGVGWCHHHIRGEGPHSGCGPAGATIRVVVSRLSLLRKTCRSHALAASPESCEVSGAPRSQLWSPVPDAYCDLGDGRGEVRVVTSAPSGASRILLKQLRGF